MPPPREYEDMQDGTGYQMRPTEPESHPSRKYIWTIIFLLAMVVILGFTVFKYQLDMKKKDREIGRLSNITLMYNAETKKKMEEF